LKSSRGPYSAKTTIEELCHTPHAGPKDPPIGPPQEELEEAVGSSDAELISAVAGRMEEANEKEIAGIVSAIDGLISAGKYGEVGDELNRLSLHMRLREKIEQALVG
jgi:hypothetical protein